MLKCIGMGVKLRSLLSQSGENNRSGDHRFPLSEGGETRPFILTRKIGPERTTVIRDYCQVRGATLNDAVLTAYYRCLFRRLALFPCAELRIPLMVEMHRYFGEAEGLNALTNLSSTVITRLEYRSEEDFEVTLGRVKAVMDEKRAAISASTHVSSQPGLSLTRKRESESPVEVEPEEPPYLYDERGDIGFGQNLLWLSTSY